MSIQLRAFRARSSITPPGASVDGSDHVSAWGRLLQATLAVYLIPVLLIVLLVGGIGLLILTVGQAIGWIDPGPARRDDSSTI